MDNDQYYYVLYFINNIITLDQKDMNNDNE
jgi:hypothetical protein